MHSPDLSKLEAQLPPIQPPVDVFAEYGVLPISTEELLGNAGIVMTRKAITGEQDAE